MKWNKLRCLHKCDWCDKDASEATDGELPEDWIRTASRGWFRGHIVCSECKSYKTRKAYYEATRGKKANPEMWKGMWNPRRIYCTPIEEEIISVPPSSTSLLSPSLLSLHFSHGVRWADDICIKNLGKGWKAHQEGFGSYAYEHVESGATLSCRASMHDEYAPAQWYLYRKGKPTEAVYNATQVRELVAKEKA